jgi:hypothetical protein
VNIDGSGVVGVNGCVPFASGSYLFDQVSVYGVNCADARRLMEHAVRPDARRGAPRAWSSDGYSWTWTPFPDDIYSITFRGEQAEADGSIRYVEAAIAPV